MRMLKLPNPLEVIKFIRYSVLANRCTDTACDYLGIYADVKTFVEYSLTAHYYKQQAEKNRTDGIIQKIVDKFVVIS